MTVELDDLLLVSTKSLLGVAIDNAAGDGSGVNQEDHEAGQLATTEEDDAAKNAGDEGECEIG